MAKVFTGLPANFNLNVSSEDLLGKPVEGYLDEDPVLEMAKLRRAQQQQKDKQVAVAPSVSETPMEDVAQVTVQDEPVNSEVVSKDFLSNETSVPKSKIAIGSMPSMTVSKTLRSHGFEEAKIDFEDIVKSQMLSAPAKGFVPTLSAPADVPASLRNEPITNSKPLHVITSDPKPKEVRARRDKNRLQINLSPDAERKLEELLAMVSEQSPQKDIMVSELFQALILNLHDARSEINVSRLPLRGKWGSPTAKSFPAALAEAFREAQVAYDQKSGGNPFKKAVGG